MNANETPLWWKNRDAMLGSTNETMSLIRKLTAEEGLVERRVVVVGARVESTADAVTGSRTVFHGTRVLSESKSLSTAELCTLLEFTQTLFALSLMVLVLHLDIALREALGPVVGKELAVPTIENVHFGIGELWVLEVVDGAVLVADELGHAGGTKLRVFTVENEKTARRRHSLEQLASKLLLVVEVQSTFDMSSIVLVFETAIDNINLIVVGVVVAVKDVQ